MVGWSNPGNSSLKQGINNGMIPKEGPKTIPYKLDFTAAQSILVDMSQQNLMEQISFVQGVYIDNSGNTAALVLISQGSNQVVSCPAGAQGYFPLLATLPNKFLVSTTGGLIVNVFFYNVPMPAATWGEGSGPFLFDANGNLRTADQNLAPLINNRDGANNALDVNVLFGGGSAGAAGLQQMSTTLDMGLLNNIIMNPSNTQQFRVAGFEVLLDADAWDNAGGAGTYGVSIIERTEGGVTVATLATMQVVINQVRPVQWGHSSRASRIIYRSPPGMLYTSAAVDNNLVVVCPAIACNNGLLRVSWAGEIYTP